MCELWNRLSFISMVLGKLAYRCAYQQLCVISSYDSSAVIKLDLSMRMRQRAKGKPLLITDSRILYALIVWCTKANGNIGGG